jgi:hypothetical protein
MNEPRKEPRQRKRDEERVKPDCKPPEPEKAEALDEDRLDRVLHDCPL